MPSCQCHNSPNLCAAVAIVRCSKRLPLCCLLPFINTNIILYMWYANSIAHVVSPKNAPFFPRNWSVNISLAWAIIQHFSIKSESFSRVKASKMIVKALPLCSVPMTAQTGHYKHNIILASGSRMSIQLAIYMYHAVKLVLDQRTKRQWFQSWISVRK